MKQPAVTPNNGGKGTPGSPNLSNEPDAIRKRLESEFAELGSQRKLAAKYGVNPRYIWDWLTNGKEPTGPDVRRALGMTPLTTAIVWIMGGEPIPPGCQVYSASICPICSQPYISNHPARTKCFMCSPYKGKKTR